MSSENDQSSAPSASRCYRAAAEKMGRQFFSHDQFSTDAIRWLSERWKDLHVEFHECEGWQVSTCYADEAWDEEGWVRCDGSLHSALLKAVEVTSR
jgi:hypothetical protein